MKKILGFILIILFLFIFAELGYYFYITQKKPTKTKKTLRSTNQPSSLPPSISPAFKIIYQDKNDHQGRTVVYKTDSPNLLNEYQGNNYFVGFFAGWENIINSSDYYLLLKQPTNNNLKKIRILFTPYKFPSGFSLQTTLNLEDLSKSKTVDRYQKSVKFLSFFSSLSWLKINSLIKEGDVLVVFPFYRKGNLVLDENKQLIGYYIVIRRYFEISL